MVDELWPPIGAVIASKYRIERLIGRGGMGVVMLARHLRLDEDVALKFLSPQAMKKPDVVARFEREARALVRLKNEHVTRVLDVEITDDGAPFIVMEFLEGQTLAGLVRGGAALPLDLAVEYMLQTCEAVAEAHALGIVHRDLKPGNLFLTTGADGSPVVKVLDFGVSKLGALDKDSGAEIETLPDAVVGSPPYMSPEQLRSSKDVDARTDIWSLGVVLFEITTGRMPFAADNLHEHYTKLMLEAPPLPTEVRTDLPAALDAITAKCLAREPRERYANVGELAADLAKLAAHDESRVRAERAARTLAVSRAQRTSRPSLPPAPSGGSAISIASTRLTAPRRTKRASRAIWIAGAAVAITGATFVAVRARPPAAEATSATTPANAQSATANATASATTTPPLATSNAIASVTAPVVVATVSAAPRVAPVVHVHVAPRASAKPPDADLDHRK